MKNNIPVIIRWTARIMSIVFAAFLSLFALDIFNEGNDFWNTALGLFMHLIPSFLVLLVLIISWRKEWIGGIVYFILGIAYLVTAWGKFDWSAYALIAGPLFVLGILFFISWMKRRTPVTE
jgi:hypothetical protein